MGSSQRIAIIGTGISGLAAAHRLAPDHHVTVYEARDRIGGHTATKTVSVGGRSYEVDTGFIVCNDRTYPNFLALMKELGVELRPTEMSFSVHCTHEDFEYNGNSLRSLFVQRRNLMRPRFLRMVAEIVRFNREALSDLHGGVAETLGEYLERKRYSKTFIGRYLVPMGAAIWSASEADMLRFPLALFVRFFDNHGLLSIDDRPQWYTVVGGSHAYLKPLAARFAENIQLDNPVERVTRSADGVRIKSRRGEHIFDQVVFACHSDQALKILGDPSSAERDVLGAIPYQQNEVVLHTDTQILPKRRGAWASWNYRVHDDSRPGDAPVSVTYDMNILQGIDAPETFCVSLNPDPQRDPIDETKVLGRYRYAHPSFGLAGERAKERFLEISGSPLRTHYCGAYWRNGFHEDGLWSALRVVDAIAPARAAAA